MNSLQSRHNAGDRSVKVGHKIIGIFGFRRCKHYNGAINNGCASGLHADYAVYVRIVRMSKVLL